MEENEVSKKSRLVTLLLCLCFGFLGAHRFYVGKNGTGVLMLFTLGGFGVWMMIDAVVITCGYFRDGEGKVVFKWLEKDSF